MMFTLNCDIKIGDVSLRSVQEVTIKRGFDQLTGTAVIKLPLTPMRKHACVSRDKQSIKEEDKVVIRLGYDNRLETEFVGYVKHFNYKTPFEIECEDESYQTRFVNCIYSSPENKTLQQCIETILPNVRIGYCTDLTPQNFLADNEPGSTMLAKIKEAYKFDVFFDLEGKLYILSPEDKKNGKYIVGDKNVKYRLNYNIITDKELKYERLKSEKICVNVVYKDEKDGKEIVGKAGEEGGMVKRIDCNDISDQNQLNKLAEAEYEKLHSYGCEGKFVTFLQPFAMPGMVAEMDNPYNPDVCGAFLIKSTEITFSAAGGRRTVQLDTRI